MRRLPPLIRWTRSSAVLLGGFFLVIFLIIYIWWPLAEELLSTMDWHGPWWLYMDWLLIGIFLFMISHVAGVLRPVSMLTGIGNTRRIILGDTLINEFTLDEIETVMASLVNMPLSIDMTGSSAKPEPLTVFDSAFTSSCPTVTFPEPEIVSCRSFAARRSDWIFPEPLTRRAETSFNVR